MGIEAGGLEATHSLKNDERVLGQRVPYIELMLEQESNLLWALGAAGAVETDEVAEPVGTAKELFVVAAGVSGVVHPE